MTRVFNAESVWDKDEQKWMQILTIDGIEVDMETYAMELENEVHDNEECVIACNCEGCDCQENEEHYEGCECPSCQEKNKMIYLAESVMHMFEEKLCPQCVFEMLQDIYDTAYDSGFEDGYAECKEEIKDFLED